MEKFYLNKISSSLCYFIETGLQERFEFSDEYKITLGLFNEQVNEDIYFAIKDKVKLKLCNIKRIESFYNTAQMIANKLNRDEDFIISLMVTNLSNLLSENYPFAISKWLCCDDKGEFLNIDYILENSIKF